MRHERSRDEVENDARPGGERAEADAGYIFLMEEQ